MSKRTIRCYLITILVISMLLSFCACSEQEQLRSIEDCYHVQTNSDLSYSYEVTDFLGKVLFSENTARKEPKFKPLSDSVLEVSAQTGTGLSTNWAVYCNLEDGVVSEKFFYVLGAKDDYVFYIEYEENRHSIICQNIFNPNVYTQEYRIEDSLVVLDSFGEADFEDEGVVKFTYLTGENAVTREYVTIYYPN